MSDTERGNRCSEKVGKRTRGEEDKVNDRANNLMGKRRDARMCDQTHCQTDKVNESLDDIPQNKADVEEDVKPDDMEDGKATTR